VEAEREGATSRQRTFDRLGRFLSGQHDPVDFALRLLHKDVGLGREVGVPMRLANMAFEKLAAAMNRGWGTRNSTVGEDDCPKSSDSCLRAESIISLNTSVAEVIYVSVRYQYRVTRILQFGRPAILLVIAPWYYFSSLLRHDTGPAGNRAAH
jgi:hypothetical protein